MKKYRLLIPPELGVFIRHLHPSLKSKIQRALEEIEINPFLGKPLKDKLAGLFSYRVTQYRIIYEIKQKEILVEVIDIAERKIVYQKAEALQRP
jgi:mRNA interferase RelE/StbE